MPQTRYQRLSEAAHPTPEPASLDDPCTCTLGDVRAALTAADAIPKGDPARAELDEEVG